MPDLNTPDIDPETGLRLIGGDMATWSDDPCCSPLLARVVRVALADIDGPVLLLGPRAAALHTLVDQPAVAVRGLLDARALHAEGVEVLCGSLPHLPDRSYAAVVCLDAPGRLLSPDDTGLGHLEVLDRVRALAPASIIAVQGASPLTIAPRIHSAAADTAWWVGQEGFDAAPPTSQEICRAAAGASLLSVLPTLGEPRLAAPFGSEPTARGRAALADHPDVLDRLRGGLWDQLAGGWLVMSGTRAPEEAFTSPIAAEGPDVARDPGADNELDLLEPGLVRHLAAGVLHRARPELDAYLDWLTDLEPAIRPFALVRNTGRRADGGLDLVETGWRLRSGSVHLTDDTVVCALAMVDFADSLVRRPGSHPFGAGLSADEVAGALLGLTGRSGRFVVDARVLHSRLGLPERPEWPADPESGREQELRHDLATVRAQLTALRTDLAKAQRRNRALEHALATESGPRAKRAFYLMTTPTNRLVEAARSRLGRRS